MRGAERPQSLKKGAEYYMKEEKDVTERKRREKKQKRHLGIAQKEAAKKNAERWRFLGGNSR